MLDHCYSLDKTRFDAASQAGSCGALGEQLSLRLVGFRWCESGRCAERGILSVWSHARFRARGSIVGIAVL